MVYVEKYHAIMQQIMATAKGDVTKCPQAEKLLYETAQMLQVRCGVLWRSVLRRFTHRAPPSTEVPQSHHCHCA